MTRKKTKLQTQQNLMTNQTMILKNLPMYSRRAKMLPSHVPVLTNTINPHAHQHSKKTATSKLLKKYELLSDELFEVQMKTEMTHSINALMDYHQRLKRQNALSQTIVTSHHKSSNILLSELSSKKACPSETRIGIQTCIVRISKCSRKLIHDMS